MKTIAEPTQSEIKIKKSQFICRLFPSKTKAESKEIINRISEEYHDATHNCSAYITSDGEGFDDNGEPSGTAGKPMLNALRKNELHNITAVVTRYFGGIKLGAGGLVRAYGKSVLEAIENSEIIEIEIYDVYRVVFPYTDIKTINQEIRNNNLHVVEKYFDENVTYDIVSKDMRDVEKIFEKFTSKIKISLIGSEALEKL